jgi:hypothetical protein
LGVGLGQGPQVLGRRRRVRRGLHLCLAREVALGRLVMLPLQPRPLLVLQGGRYREMWGGIGRSREIWGGIAATSPRPAGVGLGLG